LERRLEMDDWRGGEEDGGRRLSDRSVVEGLIDGLGTFLECFGGKRCQIA
jgi:hypothetical protein